MKIKQASSHEVQKPPKATKKAEGKLKDKQSFQEALARKKRHPSESRADAIKDPSAKEAHARGLELTGGTKGADSLSARAASSETLGRLGERAQMADAQATAQQHTREASSELFKGTRHERALDQRSDTTRDQEQIDTSLVQQDVRAEVQQSVSQTEQTQGADRADMQALVDKIVKACHVGKGERNKRVLLMTVEVPGQGEVHVKIERQRQGTAIRFRARDPALAQRLRTHAPRLQESLRAKGVGVTKLTVSARA